jgi:mono/diheme cytochrome c family protein
MHHRTVAAVLVCMLWPLASQAQAPATPPASAPPAAAVPKSYVPGLEQFMSVIQNEHAKLWYAGSARNWELAAYQLGEIKEVMSDVQDFVPTFKNLPLAQMLDGVITGAIAQLEKAVDAKDFAKFSAGYGLLTETCNSCHQATGNGFVVIQRPAQGGFPNQNFAPRK